MGLMDECVCNRGNAPSKGAIGVKDGANGEENLTMCNLCQKRIL
jgi:hypothetical protein